MWNIIPDLWFRRDLGLILKCEKFKRNEKMSSKMLDP